ncbi:PIG-L family deacetylase [Clostridium botulinum]|uniref:PIG-L family deacetylase n=1 Tax=Clostridium botulinum TaxID=1491 RepID=A0A0L9Y509_CLOBO|nr:MULTISPECIES: PIG-L family deacetylase [Clostridium]ACD53029.1 GlcNAc-PI de-N-acetylase family [Clostridium botulinum E3 str. Alaska E43]AJF29459.1 GlcNAc-PI de-N-acetylase [Clostridium botulinum]AJF32520.1 GlcNAc-PI de-N-acetylase [Clostridium botulinum]KAI3345393.1 PIG-L family deacetylase [Clostridium botulinum]KOM86703.1 GlcNAc-PI de-N-acetylase [Clostridium botulinum]
MKCKNVLIISVHPDDETIGCGGTILKHKDNGDKITWLILTSAETRYGYSYEQVMAEKKQVEDIGKAYGFDKIYNLKFGPAKINYDIFSNLINKISEVMYKVKPEIVYMINRSDVHTDHQIGAKAILSCTKSFRYPFIKRVLMYECLSETEIAPQFQENIFIPNVFSDITKYIEKKLDILKLYKTELQDIPQPRNEESVKALARYRGCTACTKYAEAFMLVRDVF